MRLLALLLPLPALWLPGCGSKSCLSGTDDDCIVETPCENLVTPCTGGTVELRVLQEGDPLLASPNPSTLAAPGDIVLQNDRVWVVIEAIDHPHYLGPAGGGIVDMGTGTAENDSMRSLIQGTGLLPTEAAHYTDLRVFEEDGMVAVQVHGTLDGFPDIPIVTRYEMRPCEDGVRVRTEIVNRTPDPQSWFSLDAWYWGGRELLPFTPGPGFEHPSFGLTTVADVITEVPFMVAGTHVEPASTYATVACNLENISGFHSTEVTAVGLEQRLVMPRDFTVYERFVGAVPGPDIADGVDLALELRRRMFQEPYVTLSGRVLDEAGDGVSGDVRASVLISEVGGDDDDGESTGPVPWSHTVPDADGRFSVRVPPDRRYRLEVLAFGQSVADVRVTASGETTDAGEIVVPTAGQLQLDATVDGETDIVLALLHPANDPTAEAVTGQLYGNFEECAPLLGHPHGTSPACNRVLVEGPTTIEVPAGTYDIAASAGPFSTLALAESVEVLPGQTATATLALQTLALQPEGTLSADLHVHGGASFDSSIPDTDRVRAFLASRLEVLATTEHDVVWDYAEAVDALDAADRVQLIAGLETTGHILFPLLSEEITYFPKVIGHWNVWPMPFDLSGPYHGAPWDELVEPGALFDRFVDAGWPEATGVIQLNHPTGGLQFGRDFGWADAIELDLTEDLGTGPKGTGNQLYTRTPPGAEHANDAYHVQEVMNGTSNATFLQYRALWHYLLDQGLVKGGTANSDSHSLTENVMGTPRTVVWADTTLDSFDADAFNAAIREGRMIGTNGPVIEATLRGVDGRDRMPSLEPFEPHPEPVLELRVTAAPWVPVTEVRVLVNGEVAHTFSDLPEVSDPLGTDILDWSASLPLAPLLPEDGDAWVVVEAGQPLIEHADLDCDGLIDTADHDGDGDIDADDVLDVDEPPVPDDDGCLDTVGPLLEPEPPDRDLSNRWYLFSLVTPDGYASSFTNPLLLDLDGEPGFQGVSR